MAAPPPTFDPGPPPPLGRELVRFTWPSRLDLLPQHVEALVQVLTDAGAVARADASWLALCADEALVNAMVHGNEGDPDLPVTVTVAVDPPVWRIGVQDAGSGFDARAIPAEDVDALEREHGRGIRLLRSWLDRLAYFHGGTYTLLERQLASAARKGGVPACA